MELPLSLSIILVSFITYSMYLSIAFKKALDDKISEIAELKSTMSQYEEYIDSMEEVDEFWFSEYLEWKVKNRDF